MNFNNSYEPELDLRDLFFYMLHKWRSILLIAFVFALLAGCYKLGGDFIETLDEYDKPKAVRDYERAFAVYELNAASYKLDMEDCQKRLEQHKTYMENSVLMQIDPYERPTASAVFFVKLDNAEWDGLPNNINLDPADSLITAYTSSLLPALNWQPLEELTGKKSIYLKELLEVNSDYSSNTFTINVIHNDGNTAQQILDIITQQTMDRYQDLNTNVNKHTLSLIEQSVSYYIDGSLANTQKANIDTVANYEKMLIEYQGNLENLERPIPPSGLKKYIVIGFIIGVFLTVCLYGSAYIFGGRLHNGNEIKNKYNYPLLGILPQYSKFTPAAFIDRFINRLENIERIAKEGEAYRLISVNISSLAGQNRNILLTGTIDTNQLQKLTEAISPLLNELKLLAVSNISLTANSLKELTACDAVILVEERQKSRMDCIQREQDLIITLRKPVLGYILL